MPILQVLTYLLARILHQVMSLLQMDLISHRLLTSLNQGHRNKKNDARMSDVNIALRKMAAEHPILLLR